MPETTAQKTEVNSIQWKIAGTLPSQNGQSKALGIAGPITGVDNDVLIIGGGANFPDGMPWAGGKKKYHDEVYLFQRKGDSLVHFKTVKLPFNLAYSACCTTPQGIVVIGGEDESGLRDDVFLLRWDKEKKDIGIEQLPSLPFALTNTSVVFFKQQVYVAGGERGTDVYNGLLRLNLNNTSAGWTGLPPLPKPISHAVMVAQSNGKEDCLYIVGGRMRTANDTSTLYSSVMQFNLGNRTWTKKQSLPYALSAGTGAAYGSRYIFLFGGDTGETFHKTEALIAAIGKETDEGKKRLLNDEKINLQSTHPGFCRQVLLYDTRKDKWKVVECIPFDAPVTTTATQWNNEVVIPSGEIRAGVRTPQILTGKIYSKM